MYTQNPRELAGPLLIGYLVTWGFQGVLCVQICTYYNAFPKDRRVWKILVYGVFTLEVIQTILATRDALTAFYTNLGHLDALVRVGLLWLSVPIFGGLVASIGRMFFVYRIKVLTQSWVPALPSILLTVFSAIGAIYASKELFLAKELGHLPIPRRYFIASGIWNGSSTICDIAIAAFVVYYLSRQETSFNRTRVQIARIIRLVVETGMLTATMTTLHFLLFAAFKGASYFTIPFMIVAKIHSNTMLWILNNRIVIKGGRDDQKNDSANFYGVQVSSQRELRIDPWQVESISSRDNHARAREDAANVDQLRFACNGYSEITRPTMSLQE